MFPRPKTVADRVDIAAASGETPRMRRPVESIHLSDLDDLTPSSTRRARANFYRDLASVGSLASSGPARPTPIRCRKRPGHRPCQGLLRVRRRDLPAAIEWSCPQCEGSGEIKGWEGTDAEMNAVNEFDDDLLDGVGPIKNHLNELFGSGWDDRRTYYNLERGYLPAGKFGSGWIASKRAIARRFRQIISGEVA